MIKTLAIETSCDDTSVGIICFDNGRFYVEDMLAFSQIQIHQKYGGVVPEIASRSHSEKIVPLLESLGMEKMDSYDHISVTTNPGLPGSLVVGVTSANMLGSFYGNKVIDVNHIHGHIFSILLDRDVGDLLFPAVVLTASGGHNDLCILKLKSGKDRLDHEDIIKGDGIESLFEINKIGSSLDDAVGECFDKVSRMLGGPYPGGAWISQKAKIGSPNERLRFNRIFLKADEYNFSFSGMKSKVYYLLEKLKQEGITLDEQMICDICYEFQESIVEVLVNKIIKATKAFECKSIFVTGGVSANDRLYEELQSNVNKKLIGEINVYTPTKKVYCTDNSAMIGVVGIINRNKL